MHAYATHKFSLILHVRPRHSTSKGCDRLLPKATERRTDGYSRYVLQCRVSKIATSGVGLQLIPLLRCEDHTEVRKSAGSFLEWTCNYGVRSHGPAAGKGAGGSRVRHSHATFQCFHLVLLCDGVPLDPAFLGTATGHTCSSFKTISFCWPNGSLFGLRYQFADKWLLRQVSSLPQRQQL